MSCGPNRTCHAACDCREAQWAEKLAAANAETTAALAWFKDSEQRLRAADAEAARLRAVATTVYEAWAVAQDGRLNVPLNLAAALYQLGAALTPPPEAGKRGEGA